MKDNDKIIGIFLQRARWDCGKSQEFMALEMGIARKTVQNWERGISEPSIVQFKKWFETLDISPMPYLLQYFYYEHSNKEIVKKFTDESIDKKKEAENRKKILIAMISDMPDDSVEQFLYLFAGNHGSSPKALLQMITAHIQTPLRARYSHSSFIMDDYLLACDKNELTDSHGVQSDADYFKKAIEEGRKAVVKGNDEYIMI